ncbi:putative uncharacterized protein [Waddlia chondrophila 2032/99]|uniref:Uncharacterized protein n=2 Tax=Waddlia chondrophila TaxID=71667 RepID=D6YS62_WADCW|nr:hypothetical protein [Waddlia chondrophila]ADI38907.1 hypothetical protein wcw_1559 [Waddlia chondrophila WSU 86-1044]CCB90425.1 putative uncharacterized protein [Waddlia chondrophila 2032/99]
MVDISPNTNLNAETQSAAQVQPSSQNAATAEASATANANKKNLKAEYDMDTVISSASDLKEKAPEVWDKMMQGIAQNIIKDMRERQERLKKMMRESREG